MRWLPPIPRRSRDRKSTRLNSSHTVISYAVFCLNKHTDHFTSMSLTTIYPNTTLFRSKEAAHDRIKMGLDYAQFGDCDMVIEAATEKEHIKREIFKKLTPALRPDALVATNTSSISRSEEHTSELQSHSDIVCRLLLE